MRAIIPTAGLGKRLRPFTHATPKVLLPVAGKPILGHIVDRLLAEGIDDVTFVVGYLGDEIEAYVKQAHPDCRARFVRQEEARGLGHAIFVTRDLHADSDEPLLILLGDTIIEADLPALKGASDNVIGVSKVDEPSNYGIVELNGDTVSALVEKPEDPPTDLAIVGVYCITNPRLLFECLQENVDSGVLTKGEIQLTDALQLMLTKGAVMRTLVIDEWYDCGNPAALLVANRALLRKGCATLPAELERRYPRAVFRPPVFVAPSARIARSVVGPDASIGEDATVEDAVVRDSTVCADAEVRHAVLSGSIVGENARVTGLAGQAFVGNDAVVAPGEGFPH